MAKKEPRDSVDDIELLGPLESVRRRPELYLGDLGASGLPNTLLLQSLCHALDAATDNECSKVLIAATGSRADVLYDAPMPLSPHPSGDSVAFVMLTSLAACSNLKKHVRVGDKYCSLGLAVLNAVSRSFRAEIVAAESRAVYSFNRGRPAEDALDARRDDLLSGTRLSFELDGDILGENTEFDLTSLRERCLRLAEEFPGLTLSVGEPDSPTQEN